jgi:glycine C-acetyltransferase
VAPPVVAGAIRALELVAHEPELRTRLKENAGYFRAGLEAAGFDLLPGDHPIIPVMLYDARKAARVAEEIRRRGVYVVAFSYPVVPNGQARIRTQMSAALTKDDLDVAIEAFSQAR